MIYNKQFQHGKVLEQSSNVNVSRSFLTSRVMGMNQSQQKLKKKQQNQLEKEYIRYGQVIQLCGIADESTSGFLYSKGWSNTNVNFIKTDNMENNNCTRESLFRILPRGQFYIHDQYQKASKEEKKILQSRKQREHKHYNNIVKLMNGTEVYFGSEIILQHLDTNDYLCGTHDCPQNPPDSFKLKLRPSLNSMTLFKIVPMNLFNIEGDRIQQRQEFFLQHVKTGYFINRVLLDSTEKKFQKEMTKQTLYYQKRGILQIKLPQTIKNGQQRCILTTQCETIWQFNQIFDYDYSEDNEDIFNYDLVQIIHNRNNGIFSKSDTSNNLVLKEQDQSMSMPLYDSIFEILKSDDNSDNQDFISLRYITSGQLVTIQETSSLKSNQNNFSNKQSIPLTFSKPSPKKEGEQINNFNQKNSFIQKLESSYLNGQDESEPNINTSLLIQHAYHRDSQTGQQLIGQSGRFRSQPQQEEQIKHPNFLKNYSNIHEENSEDEDEQQSQNQSNFKARFSNQSTDSQQQQNMFYSVLNKQKQKRLSNTSFVKNEVSMTFMQNEQPENCEFQFVLEEFDSQKLKENYQIQIRQIRNNQITNENNNQKEDEDNFEVGEEKGLIMKKSPCFIKFIKRDYECIDFQNNEINSSAQVQQQSQNQIFAISFHKKTLIQRRSSFHLYQNLNFLEQKSPEKINYVMKDSQVGKSTLKFTESMDEMTESQQQQLGAFYFENKIGFDKQISRSGFRIVKVQSNLKRIILEALSTQEQIHKLNCVLNSSIELDKIIENMSIKSIKQTIKCIKQMGSLLSDDNDLLENGLGMYCNNPTQLSIAISKQEEISESQLEEQNYSTLDEKGAASNYNEQISENIRQVQNILVDTKLMYLVVFLINSLTYKYNFIQLTKEKDKQLSSYLNQLLQQCYELLRQIIQDNQKAKFLICQYLEIFIKNAFDNEDEEVIQNFLKELFQDNQMIIQDLITPHYIQNIIHFIYTKEQPHPIHCIILSALTQCNDQAVAQNQQCIIKYFFQNLQNQVFHFTFERDQIIYKVNKKGDCQVTKLKIINFLQNSLDKQQENLYLYFIKYIELLSNICFGRNKIGIDFVRQLITVDQVLLFLDTQKHSIINTDIIGKIQSSMLKLLQNTFLESYQLFEKARNWNEIKLDANKNCQNAQYLKEIKGAIDYINNFFTNFNPNSFTNTIFLTQMLEVYKISEQWKEFINIKPSPEVERVEQTLIQQLIKLQNSTVFNILLYLLQRIFSKKRELFENLQKVVMYQKGDALEISDKILQNRYLFQLLNEPNFRYSLFNFQKTTSSQVSQNSQLQSQKLQNNNQIESINNSKHFSAYSHEKQDQKKGIVSKQLEDLQLKQIKSNYQSEEDNNSDRVDKEFGRKVESSRTLENDSSPKTHQITLSTKEEFNFINDFISKSNKDNLEKIQQSQACNEEKNIVFNLLTGGDESMADSSNLNNFPNPMLSSPTQSNNSPCQNINDIDLKDQKNKLNTSVQDHKSNFYQSALPHLQESVEGNFGLSGLIKKRSSFEEDEEGNEDNISFHSENPDNQAESKSQNDQINPFDEIKEIDQNHFELLINFINTLSYSMKVNNNLIQLNFKSQKQITEQEFSQICINFISERDDHNLLIQNLIRSYDLHLILLKFLNDTQYERKKDQVNLKTLLTSIYQFFTLMIWNNNEAKIDLYTIKNIAVNHLILNVGSIEFLKELYNNSKQLLFNQSEIIYISQSILRTAFFTQIQFYKAKLIYFLRTLLVQNDKPIKDNQEIVFSEIQKFQDLKIFDPENLEQIIQQRIEEYSNNLKKSFQSKLLVIDCEIMTLMAMFSLYSMLVEGPNIILRKKFNRIHPFKLLIKLLQKSSECIPLKKEIRSYLNRAYYSQQYVAVKKYALIHYPQITKKRNLLKQSSYQELSLVSKKSSSFQQISQDQSKQIKNDINRNDSLQNDCLAKDNMLTKQNKILRLLKHTLSYLKFDSHKAKLYISIKFSKFMDKLVQGYQERKRNSTDVQQIISEIQQIKNQKQLKEEDKYYLSAAEIFLQPSFKIWSVNDILDFLIDKYIKYNERKKSQIENQQQTSFQNIEIRDLKELPLETLNTEISGIFDKSDNCSLDLNDYQNNEEQNNEEDDSYESDESFEGENEDSYINSQQKININRKKQQMKDKLKNMNEEEDEEVFQNIMINRQKRIQANVKNFIRQNKSLFKNDILQNSNKNDLNENQSMLKDSSAVNFVIQDLQNIQVDLEQYLEYKSNPSKYDEIQIDNYIRFKHLQSYILLNFKEVVYTLGFIFKNQYLLSKKLKPALKDQSSTLRITLRRIHSLLKQISEKDQYYQIIIEETCKLISDFTPEDNLAQKKQNIQRSSFINIKITESLRGTKSNNSPASNNNICDSKLDRRQQFLSNAKQQLTIEEIQGNVSKKEREPNKYKSKFMAQIGQQQKEINTKIKENEINDKFNNLYIKILQQLNFSSQFQDFLQKENQRIFDVLQNIPKRSSQLKITNGDDENNLFVSAETISQNNLIQSLFDVALSHQDLPDDLHVFYLNILVGMVKRQNKATQNSNQQKDDLEVDQWKTEHWIDNKNEIIQIQKQLRMYGGIRLLCNLLQQQNLEQRLSLVSHTLLYGMTLMLGGNQKTQKGFITLLIRDTQNTILINIAALIQKIGKIAYRFSKESNYQKRYIDSYNYFDPDSQQIIRKNTCLPDDYQEEQKMELCFLVLQRIFQFLKLCVVNNIEMKNYLRCQTFINKRQKLNSINFVKVACDTNQQFSKVLKKETHEVCNYIADFVTEMVKVPCTLNQISLSQTSYFEDICLLPQLINKQREFQKQNYFNQQIDSAEKKEQEDELHTLYSKILQCIIVVLEGDDVQIYDEILSKVPLEFLQIIFNQYIKLIKIQSLSEIRYDLEQEIQNFQSQPQSQEEKQKILENLQNEIKSSQINQLKKALKERIVNGNYNQEIKNIFQVLIIVKIFSQYDQTISQHFKALVTFEYYQIVEYLDQQILSISIVDQQKYKNVFFVDEPLFSYLSQETKKLIMKKVNRDTQRDKLIDLINYSLETIPNEMEYNYYLGQKAIPMTYETIKIIQTVIAYYGIFINILMAFTAAVQINKHSGIRLYFESDFPLFNLEFLIFIFFLLVITFTVFTAMNQVPPKIDLPLELVDKDSKQQNSTIMQYFKLIKYKIQTNKLFLLYKYNEISYLIMLIVSSFLSLIIHPKFIVLSLPYSVSKLKYVKGVAENLYLAIFMKRRELILICFLGIIFLYIFSVLSFNNYYLEVYSEEALENEPQNKCSTLLQCMITLILSGVVGNNMSDWELSTFFSDTLYFIFMSILFTNIITGIMTDTFAELRDQIHFRENDKRNKCYICGVEKLILENQGEPFDQHIQFHDVWKYSYYIYTINQKNEEQNTGIELQIKKMISKEDLSWLPVYSEENSQ